MIRPFLKKRFDLKGKSAIVTGAAGILGPWFSAALAEYGANVAVADIREKAAKDLAQELRKVFKVKAIGIGCDVSDPRSVKSMVAAAARALGSVDILHNNAASKTKDLDAYFEKFENYSLKTWRQAMGVNLDGMMLVATEVGKRMIQQGRGGSIIQTASIYGILAPDHRIYEGSFYLGRQINTPAVYSVSKGGVVMLTRYLATYWKDAGIRVNTITPGGVQSGQNDEFVRRYAARIPLGRMARPQEMAGALVYLASDASSYVTGHNLIVDGGLNAW